MTMEHPLVQIDPDITQDNLFARIQELNRKLQIARRMGNAHLAGQIQMALASHQTLYSQRLEAQAKKDQSQLPDYSDRIDIS